MSETVPFILAGIASGAIYSLAGVGLVLTFKTSGIFNFAHGALASVGALGFYALTVVTGVPPVVGTLVVLIGASALIGLLAEPFAARLASKPLALKVAGTVGVLLAVQGTAGVLLDGNTDYFPSLLPAQGIALGGLTIGVDQLIGVAISLSCAVGLSVFFKVARTGRAMRAVVDNPDLMGLSGIDPRRIRRIAWIIGAFLVTLSGLLLAPHLAVNGNGLTMLVVQAFGAAAIGSFRHVWRTWFGGLIVGIVSSLATAWFGSVPTLQGLPAAVPFLVLFVVLTVSRRTTGWAIVPRVQAHPRAPLRHQVLPALTAFGFFAIVPFFAGPYLGGWTISLAYVVLFLSMGLLLRHSGQVSLGHVSFAAIGAVSFSQFTVELGLPWLVGLLLAGLVVVPIGAVLAVPAIRASGLYLAIATFGFGLVMQNLFYSQDYMFGTNSSGRPMPQPDILVGTDGQAVAYYYVLLVIVVAVAVGVVAIVRTRLGRLLTALSDAPVALASVGTSVNSVKILVFCLSAFMAGLGGALYGVAFGAVTAQSFDPIISLSLVTLIVITVGGAPWYAILAALGFGVLPTYLSGQVNLYLQIAFGAFAMFAAAGPQLSLPTRRRRTRPTTVPAPRRSAVTVAGPVLSAPVAPHGPTSSGSGLIIEDLTVAFGSVIAVSGLSLKAPHGVVTGLIGPNGAGKTTTFNVCSGLVRPMSGTIRLNGGDVTRLGPDRRARLGLGRTFQRMQLFDSLTVAENVALGREGAIAAANPFAQLVTTARDARLVAGRTAEALDLCRLGPLAHTVVGTLSTGHRRLVELARCLAGQFDVLLLDEPSSGLDSAETERFAQILAEVIARRGPGMLLVEHDLALVMAVCAHIYVLDFGRPIFDGPPAEVMASEVVHAAYVGDAARLEGASGGVD